MHYLIQKLPFCIIVIWGGWQFTAAAYNLGVQPSTVSEFFTQLTTAGIGESSQDPGGLMNRWIIKGVIPLSFVCLLLASVSFFINRLSTYLQISGDNLQVSDDSPVSGSEK